jgi:hypothetical protein
VSGSVEAAGDDHQRTVDADGAEAPELAAEAEEAPDRVAVPWRPRFDQADDLGGVLSARSPLLARAFGGLRRSAPEAPRGE